MIRINKWCLLGIFVLACGLSKHSFTESTTMVQAKDKLKRLDEQINQLKYTLSHAQNKRAILNHELANTEKKIGDCIQKINVIQHDMTLKQQNILKLQQRMATLSHDLLKQQAFLAEHVRARYQLGEYRPMIIALNQNNLYKVSQLLTLYQYLVQSRQDVIATIIHMQKKLTIDQKALTQEVREQEDLQRQLRIQQENFEQSKRYHQHLIQSLNQDIQSQQRVLSDYEKNKVNLSRLLQTLVRESQRVVKPAQAFMNMRHQLPLPVKVSRKAIQYTTQGVTFWGREGLRVQAVYPGRVVFSDWLKGYGLLLIIDHGEGFMTLYAHNQALFKQKGSQVVQGEQIATIGHSGGLKQSGLYFEVRQRGKVVSPRQWL